MGLLLVLVLALAACAVVFGPLILPGALIAAGLFVLFQVVSRARRRHGQLRGSEAGGLSERAASLLRAAWEKTARVGSSRQLSPQAVGSLTAGEAPIASTGLDLVRALRDAVMPAVGSDATSASQGICPVLSGLANGSPLAERVRCGHDRKTELLQSFEALSSEVAPHNLYPVAGSEAEQVIERLGTSLRGSQPEERADCDLCGRVLEGLAGWRQAHFGPSPTDASARSPRRTLVNVLKEQAYDEPTSVGPVLEAFENSVASFATELETAPDDAARDRAAERLMAAVAIHDSVESGVLGPILKRAPGGGPLAARLHEGFAYHALLGRSFEATRKEDSEGSGNEDTEQILAALVASLRAHRHEEMAEVVDLLDGLPASTFRTLRSPLDDAMWPWHSGGATLLAIRLALWADSAPSRAHALTVKHPSSRALRSFTHFADNVHDYTGRG